MPQYLLSVHSADGEPREPKTDEQMEQFWQEVGPLEADMKSSGTWVFSGRLHDADSATVVRVAGGEVLTTDGPYVEAREHIAGFYIIEASDLDAALGWASRVTRAISTPVEVWPFADTAGG